MVVANTLAYYDCGITTVKSFILKPISLNFFRAFRSFYLGKLDHFVALEKILNIYETVYFAKMYKNVNKFSQKRFYTIKSWNSSDNFLSNLPTICKLDLFSAVEQFLYSYKTVQLTLPDVFYRIGSSSYFLDLSPTIKIEAKTKWFVS